MEVEDVAGMDGSDASARNHIGNDMWDVAMERRGKKLIEQATIPSSNRGSPLFRYFTSSEFVIDQFFIEIWALFCGWAFSLSVGLTNFYLL